MGLDEPGGKLVIFDCDGVLVDTVPFRRRKSADASITAFIPLVSPCERGRSAPSATLQRSTASWRRSPNMVKHARKWLESETIRMDDARRLWAAGIFPWGTEIFGGMWDTDRLYRTRTEAIRDIEDHAIKMGLLPISWSTPDEKLTIGRTRKPGDDLTYVVLVRSARLPDDM
jgi:phosphoglycolate phosphatase-like HAD superfamily hydrolase